MSSGTETPVFWGNLFSPYFLFRSENIVGDSGSRTGETIIAFLTANTLDFLAFWSANINNNSNNSCYFSRNCFSAMFIYGIKMDVFL
jgi:hypothetical protein